MISTIGVYTRNIDREIVKARKLYFCDTGIANILSDLNSGSQFENSLYNQLSKNGRLQYYSLKNGNEIDFILNKTLALEAKETPTSDDLSNLAKIAHAAKIADIKLIGRNQSPKFNNYLWGGSIV